MPHRLSARSKISSYQKTRIPDTPEVIGRWGFGERAGSRSFPSQARASMNLAIGRLCAIMIVIDSLQAGSAGTVLKEPVTLVRERKERRYRKGSKPWPKP